MKIRILLTSTARPAFVANGPKAIPHLKKIQKRSINTSMIGFSMLFLAGSFLTFLGGAALGQSSITSAAQPDSSL
jgi:hypothetical protein